MSLEESPAPPHSPVAVEETPEVVVADTHPPDDPPPADRRRSSRRSGKSTRRCSELCEEFLPDNDDDDGEMQRLAALVEEEDAAAAGSSSNLPTRRSQMKKNRQCSQLVELGDDVLQELHKADHGAEAGQVHLDKVIPRHTHRRSSLLEADPNEISYHPSVLHMYAPPRQRQEWGQRQVLPRVNWGDLFFDLFYVAAAYNVSTKKKSTFHICDVKSKSKSFLFYSHTQGIQHSSGISFGTRATLLLGLFLGSTRRLES